MDTAQSSEQLTARTDTATHTRITNPRLLLIVRAVWLVVVGFALGVFVARIPTNYDQLIHFRSTFGLVPDPEAVRAGLAQLGLSPGFYTTYMVVVSIAFGCVFFVIAAVIFRRKSDEWLALFFSLTLVTFGATFPATDALVAVVQPPWGVVVRFLAEYGFLSFWVLFYLFPDGRFVPRWTRPLTVVLIAILLFSTLFSGSTLDTDTGDTDTLPEWLTATISIGFLVSFVFAQIYRYRHVSSPLQRQQTKWVVFGFTAAIVTFTVVELLSAVPSLHQPGIPATLYELAGTTVGLLVVALVPMSVGIAMLRYRLWEVDLVINRGLVYGGLTLALGTVFLVGLFLLQSVLGAVLGGQQNTTAAVISTALIVGLFNPTRRRLQRFVDYRFYHLRVDLNQLAEAQKPKAIPNPGALSGTKLGSYEVGEVLGRGGMGEVYKGHQTGLDRTVAIKILPPELAKNAEFRARFEREAKTVAILRHPNIVHVFDFGNAESLYYMVMEFIDGQELGDYLREHGTIPLDTARPIIQDIASALDYAHEQGLVHRDVKPSNVMLQKVTSTGTGTPHQRSILMDFGITKLVTDSTGLTHTGGTMGTLDYMAPEQIMSAKEVDKRADVYSLSVMVYQMLTGQLPFKSEGLGQLLFAHLQQPAPDPRDLQPALPAHVAKAITQALAKKPDERFQTAGEFAAALG